jgi:hypothetical protein
MIKIVQSSMVDAEYQKAVIGNYLYGDVAIPEKKDDYYLFPKLREEMKENNQEEEKPKRPTRKVADEAPARKAVEEAPVRKRAVGITDATVVEEEEAPARRRAATEEPAEEPTRSRRRSIVDDIENLDDN